MSGRARWGGARTASAYREWTERRSRRPTEELAGERLARLGTDAERWAAEFAKTLAGWSDDLKLQVVMDPSPGEWLHGWFCNAIEAGRSEGFQEGQFHGSLRARLRFAAWRLTDPTRVALRNRYVRAELGLAQRLPSRVRRAVVVQAAVEAVEADMPNRPDGYAGPDGLTYKELYYAAERTPVPR